MIWMEVEYFLEILWCSDLLKWIGEDVEFFFVSVLSHKSIQQKFSRPQIFIEF